MAGPTSATPGSRITYTYTATNAGPNEASGVTANVTLGINMEVPTATTTRGTCTIDGSVVSCALGTVPNGGGATISVSAVIPGRGSDVQTVGRIEGAGTDPALINNQAVILTNIEVPPPSGGGGGTSSLLWLLALASFTRFSGEARRRTRA